MKRLILKNPYQLYFKMLMPFLLSILLVILVLSSILYSNFEKVALRLVYQQKKTVSQSLIQNISTIKETARALSLQIFFDDTVSDILYSDVEPVYFRKYLNKLRSYRNIYPLINSIYIYNGHNIYAIPSNYFLYNASSFEDRELIGILADMKNYKSHSLIPRRIPVLFNSAGSSSKYANVYTYLFYDSQLQSGKISEAIMLNISEEWVRQSIQPGKTGIAGHNFIIDSSGRLMTNNLKASMLTDLSAKNYIKNILSSKEHSGYFKADVNGTDSFIIFADTDVFDWKLVSIIPYHEIIKDIESMKSKTLLFVLCMLLGGIIITIYLANRIYVPVKSLIVNLDMLNSEKEREFDSRKQEALRKEIMDHSQNNPDPLRSIFTKYNIGLELTGNFSISLIKIDNMHDFCLTYTNNDRQLITQGMKKLILDILPLSLKYECIHMEEDHIIILISYGNQNIPLHNEEMLGLFHEMQEAIARHLNISVSITQSGIFDSLTLLSEQYYKTLDLSYYRLIMGHKSVIFQNSMSFLTNEYRYPTDKDKQLTSSLMQCHISDSKQVLTDILQDAARYSLATLNSALVRVLLSVTTAIELLKTNNDLQINCNFNVYFSSLQKLETLEEIKTLFFTLFDELEIEIMQKKDDRLVNLINSVTDIIKNEYKNPCLSLESVAEEVNISPSYLGRLFKKHSSKNFVEFINNVRLEKARELLSYTNYPIDTIMEQTGFISRSHFFTQFKKAYGVTPNNYRSNSKSQTVVL